MVLLTRSSSLADAVSLESTWFVSETTVVYDRLV